MMDNKVNSFIVNGNDAAWFSKLATRQFPSFFKRDINEHSPYLDAARGADRRHPYFSHAEIIKLYYRSLSDHNRRGRTIRDQLPPSLKAHIILISQPDHHGDVICCYA